MTRERPRLTLRAIEVFVAIVDEGSMAGAARRLGAGVSSISQQLSNLELALGAQLVDRAARPMALTPAGYLFQRRALAILDESLRAQTELAEHDMARLPALRLAVIEEFDAEVTPALVLGLAESLPGCGFTVRAGPSHQNFADLEQRAVDLVLAAEVSAPPDWVEQHAILRDPFILVTAPGLIRPGADALEAVMAAPMVRYATGQLIGQQIARQLRRLRLAPAHTFEFESSQALLAMVERSGGWAVTTPLALRRAGTMSATLDAHPLPFKAFARKITLYARRDLLGAVPAQAAQAARTLAEASIVAPAISAMPWLSGALRIEGGPPEAAGPERKLRV